MLSTFESTFSFIPQFPYHFDYSISGLRGHKHFLRSFENIMSRHLKVVKLWVWTIFANISKTSILFLLAFEIILPYDSILFHFIPYCSVSFHIVVHCSISLCIVPYRNLLFLTYHSVMNNTLDPR